MAWHLRLSSALLNVRWSLSSKDVGNVDDISRRGTNVVEVGSELGANGSVSEVLFHHAGLALSIAFPSVELNLLALYCLKFILVCSVPIDISDNPRILEIYDSIVNEELGCGRGVKNVEVVIFDPRSIEIGSRVCTCVKGDGVFGITLLADPYDMSINPNLPESDIACHLILSILIEKDKWVLPCITVVILALSGSWMVRVVKLLSELRNIGDGTRHG